MYIFHRDIAWYTEALFSVWLIFRSVLPSSTITVSHCPFRYNLHSFTLHLWNRFLVWRLIYKLCQLLKVLQWHIICVKFMSILFNRVTWLLMQRLHIPAYLRLQNLAQLLQCVCQLTLYHEVETLMKCNRLWMVLMKGVVCLKYIS